jgi:hypothetical protein
VSDAARVSDAAGEARLVRASALPMAALLDEAIATTADVATRVGDDAALAWFVATARRVDPRVASVALGVIASVRATAPSEPTFGERLARAQEGVAAQREALARAAELRASRGDAIDAAHAAARTATTAAIDAELAARLREIETTRSRDLATVDRWYAQEQPLRVAEAYVARDAALAAAERARRAAIDVAHDEHVAAIAAHHARTMAAIERAHAAYDSAVAERSGSVDDVRERRERELAAIDRIEDPSIRERLAQGAAQQFAGAMAAASARADAIEVRAREDRDGAIARAEADENAARARENARYDARVAEAERTYARAVRDAEAAPLDTEQSLMRAAVTRRSAIEATATAASRDARELAAARHSREVDEAATVAARARAAEIDDELAVLDRIARGGGDD